MFAVPPDIKTEVFARLPDRYRVSSGRSRWVDIQRNGAPTGSFLEGPSFDKAGNLYVVDVPWGRIFRVSPAGEFDLVAEYEGEPNGLKIHRDGRIFVADYRHGIMNLDPASGKVTPFLDRAELDRFKGVNDLVFADNGDLYFTDQGLTGLHDPTGRLYRLSAKDGRLEAVLQGIPSPNGLVLNLDDSAVFVNVTRDNAVWRVPMMANGKAFKVGAFIRLSGGGGPDGLAIDEAGNLAVAHLGLGSVWLFNPMGEPIARIRSCAGPLTTNVAYGGADRRTLYITESETGQILAAKLDVPGRRMFSHSA
ncbi:gluconolactonase [Afipia sp. Root123D2]|uniref:SMP-30/gluconolactonase/LRE family protein n=1 Tax=Afipia sp. Root123D2 TaxID=1736436 RepID=UPI0006FDAC84|nr:SMP-30/gluconolactonase/LRE family protein [Afipia sp. Root123D2]KQW20437.1 gluconolactonase [Afipia sp. Root123D2]